MVTICGIDEAGRGPILGPLVICGVSVDQKDHEKFRKIGAKDSKLLTSKQRENLVFGIHEIAKEYKLITVNPEEIDAAVTNPGSNLNWLEADKAIQIIDALKPDEVYLDCPSPNIPAFTEYVHTRLKHKTKLHCAHHADRDYPVVSAASILAKVNRDAQIEEIKKKIGVDFGSGYGHDPKTIPFIEKYWAKYPLLFRHSWKNYQAQVNKMKQGKLDQYG